MLNMETFHELAWRPSLWRVLLISSRIPLGFFSEWWWVGRPAWGVRCWLLSGKGNWKARRRLVHTGFACLITGPQWIVWVVFREYREGCRLRRFIVVCNGWGCRISIFISLSKRRIFVEDNFILLQTFASRSKMRQKGQGVCFVEIYFCFSVLKHHRSCLWWPSPVLKTFCWSSQTLQLSTRPRSCRSWVRRNRILIYILNFLHHCSLFRFSRVRRWQQQQQQHLREGQWQFLNRFLHQVNKC